MPQPSINIRNLNFRNRGKNESVKYRKKGEHMLDELFSYLINNSINYYELNNLDHLIFQLQNLLINKNDVVIKKIGTIKL